MEVSGRSGRHIPGEMAEWLKAPVLKTFALDPELTPGTLDLSVFMWYTTFA